MITAVGQRVRSLVPKRDAERLEDSLREVRRLDEAHKTIEAHWRRHASCNYFVEKLQRAEQRYAQTNENLEAVLLAECVLEKAKQRATVAQAQITYGAIDEQFRREFPENREVLVRACKLQLAVARAELARITVEETERLKAHRFDAETAKQSPIIKRATSKVEGRESLLAKIQSTAIEDVWNQYASAVLSG